MKRSKALQTAFLACGLAFSVGAYAEGPSGSMLGNTCAGCHGTNGVSVGPGPTIAGLAESYFIDAMAGFQSGETRSTIMTRIAKGYTEDEIASMAKFFAGKKYVMASQSSDSAAASRGAKLHDKYCEKCHAEGGTDPEDESGYLGGQHKTYLKYTLTDFLDGARNVDKKMGKKLKKLHEKEGDKGISDLVEYYASQK
jgi:sulfide dehydrogenase cytochrome subunit